ncbi:hypothetical protein MKEN_01025300 [Mycena kentingensis (nom. inval.)]|nr:hypothetical protein MKEN_01025300 [Mycena kentingensis (nom. inval.)]
MLPPSPPPFPMASPPTLFVTAQQVAPLPPATKAPRKPALQCKTCGRGKAAPSCGLCRQCCVKTVDLCAVKSHVDKTALSAAPTRAVHLPPRVPFAGPLTIRLPPSTPAALRVETTWAGDHNDLTTFNDSDYDNGDMQYSSIPYDPPYDSNFDAEHAREYITAASPSPSPPTPSPPTPFLVSDMYNALSGHPPLPTNTKDSLATPAPYFSASPTPPPPSQPRTISVHDSSPPPSSAPSTEPSAPPTSSRPRRKRAAAASVPKPSPAPLPITLQLTDDWWGARGGPSIAGIISPPTPTLSMRPPEAHRPLVEKREHKHFDLFYWLEPGMKAKGILVDKCPRFPRYKLDDAADDYAPDLFVGIGPRDKLDVYYPKYRTWMGAHRDVLLTVSTGGVIFVRRQNEGWDEVALEKEMAGYIPEPSTNIVYELKAERKAVRDSYAKLRKLGKGGLPWVDEDEDEDERRSQSRKRTQSAAELPLPLPTRPRLTLNTNAMLDTIMDDNNILSPTSTCYPASPSSTSDSSSPISLYSSLPPSPLTSPSSLPPSPAPCPAIVRKSRKPPFAEGMDVVDVAAGFLRMKAVELRR